MAMDKEKTRYANTVICLMMLCMRPILRKLLRSTVKKQSPRGRRSWGIDKFLASNKGRIERELLTIDHDNMYRNVLYPPDEESPRTDIHKWDFTLYLFIFDICRINRPKAYFFKQLFDIRNDFCKSSNSAITRDICKDYRKRIKRLRSKFYRYLRDDDLKEKIEERANEIESGELSSSEIEEVLQRWKDLEVSKVISDAKKKNGLDKYLIVKTLLSKCCAEVMRALVIETAKRNGAPQDHTGHWSLDRFLRQHKSRIERRIHTVDKLERPMDTLFPRKGKTELDEWDESLLSFILLNVCFLDEQMADNVADIRKVRNEISHSSTALNLTDSQYESYLERLKRSIKVCLNFIDNQDLSSSINAKVCEIEFEEVDKNKTIRRLQSSYQKDREDQEKREKAREVHKRMQNELSEIVKKFKSIEMPEHQLELVIKNSSQELEKKLSKCIVENINGLVKSENGLPSPSENDDDIEMTIAVANLLDKWKSKGWVITEAIEGSVLLNVRCSTFDDVCYMYNTHKGEGSNMHVSDLQTALQEIIGLDVKLSLVMYDCEMEKFMEKIVSSLLSRSKALTSLNTNGDRNVTKVRLYMNRCLPNAPTLTDVDLKELDGHLRRIAEVLEKKHDLPSVCLHVCEEEMQSEVKEDLQMSRNMKLSGQPNPILDRVDFEMNSLDNYKQKMETETAGKADVSDETKRHEYITNANSYCRTSSETKSTYSSSTEEWREFKNTDEGPIFMEKDIRLDVENIRLATRKPKLEHKTLVRDPGDVNCRNYQEQDARSEVKITAVGSSNVKDEISAVKYTLGKEIVTEYRAYCTHMEAIVADYIRVVRDFSKRGEAFAMLEEQSYHTNFGERKEESNNQLDQLRQESNPFAASIQSASRITSVPDMCEFDPYCSELYTEALKEGVEKDRSIRINIVGFFKKGKTSLMKKLFGNESTKGVDIDHDTCFVLFYHDTCYKTNDGKVNFRKAVENEPDIIERFASIDLNSEISDSTSVVSKCKQQATHYMSTDIQRFEHYAFDKVTKQKQICSDRSHNYNYASKMDYKTDNGNEKDTQLAILSEKEIDTFTKAFSATEFDMWDFGGQYVFYATHTIFHSRRAIYLLVFDLSSNLNSVVIDKDFPTESNSINMEDCAQFWMQSIHSTVGSEDGTEPKVILVGTHKDKIEGSTEHKQRYIDKYFDDVRKLFDGTKMLQHLHHENFAVDNTDTKDASIATLKETICKLGDEETNMLKIPTKWIELEKSLKERKHIKILSLKLVMDIDRENDYPLSDLEQVKLFLKYQHKIGTFVYFDAEPISEYVLLDPQYLVNAFRTLITSKRFCTNDPKIRSAWNKLQTDARLEKCLVDSIWGENELYCEHKEILLSFLTKHHILSEVTLFSEITETSTGQGWYIIPSLLRDHSEKQDMQDFLQGKEQSHIRLIMSFEHPHIVQIIYHRFIAALIAKWPIVNVGRKPLIFRNLCVVRLDKNHAGISEMKLSGIELTVVNLCPSLQDEGGIADMFRRYSETVIMHGFRRLRDKKENNRPYTLMYRCNHRSHGMNGSIGIATVEELDNGRLVPCPDFFNHALHTDKAKSEWFQDCRKPISVPDVYLNDKLLGKLSLCIGENWQLLGYELGLTLVQLERIIEDYPIDTLKIYHMLNKWCLKMPDIATLEYLVRAMQNCQPLSVDWNELRNIIDAIV